MILDFKKNNTEVSLTRLTGQAIAEPFPKIKVYGMIVDSSDLLSYVIENFSDLFQQE